MELVTLEAHQGLQTFGQAPDRLGRPATFRLPRQPDPDVGEAHVVRAPQEPLGRVDIAIVEVRATAPGQGIGCSPASPA